MCKQSLGSAGGTWGMLAAFSKVKSLCYFLSSFYPPLGLSRWFVILFKLWRQYVSRLFFPFGPWMGNSWSPLQKRFLAWWHATLLYRFCWLRMSLVYYHNYPPRLSGGKELPSVTIKGKREVLDLVFTQTLPSHLPLWEYCQRHGAVFVHIHGMYNMLAPSLALVQKATSICWVWASSCLQKLIDEIQGSPVVVTVVPAIVIMALLEECWIAPLTYKHDGTERQSSWGIKNNHLLPSNVKSFFMNHNIKVFRV